jgi:hypothetical protein
MMERAHSVAEHLTAGLPAGSPRSASRLGDDAEIERIIAARAALRARGEAVRWRFRLVVGESVMMALLVLVAGLLLHRPSALVLQAAALVGLCSLAAGTLLIALTAATGNILARFCRKRIR